MSLASTAWESAQVRVTRTFLEVVEMCPAPEPKSATMPALPSLGFDLEEEFAPGYAVLAEPSFEEKHHEPDQDQKFAVRVARTFLEVMPDVTDDEIAGQQLRSYSMPILPSCGLDVEQEREEEESFGAFVGHVASDPIPRCSPIFHPNLAEPIVDMPEPGKEMTPPPHWAAPLLPGLVVHPVHGDPKVDLQTWEEMDAELITEEAKTVGKEDDREELKLVPQHADTHSGPFPLRMVEQHNNGRCFPCLFFTSRGDGCRKGDDCTHCHVCRPHEIRGRRNRIAAEMKAAKKAAARRQHHRA